jgi:hypothetical protein
MAEAELEGQVGTPLQIDEFRRRVHRTPLRSPRDK